MVAILKKGQELRRKFRGKRGRRRGTDRSREKRGKDRGEGEFFTTFSNFYVENSTDGGKVRGSKIVNVLVKKGGEECRRRRGAKVLNVGRLGTLKFG